MHHAVGIVNEGGHEGDDVMTWPWNRPHQHGERRPTREHLPAYSEHGAGKCERITAQCIDGRLQAPRPLDRGYDVLDLERQRNRMRGLKAA
jgi:hypothetical protein